MLASPQTMTVDSVATALDRTVDERSSSIYSSADGNIKLTVSHQESKSRTRRMARLDKTIVAADPLNAVNVYQKASVYLVIDEPAFGFTDAQLTGYVNSLKAWLTDTITGALLANRH